MERRIITQDDAVVNLNNIIRLSVERGEIADEMTGEMKDKVAVIGTDVTGEIIVIGAYDSYFAANQVMEGIVNWLKQSGEPPYEIPHEDRR